MDWSYERIAETGGAGCYALHASETSLWKIGRTSNLGGRAAELSAGLPYELRLDRFWFCHDDEDSRILEHALHGILSGYRLVDPRTGQLREWFQIDYKTRLWLFDMTREEIYKRAYRLRLLD